jgi:hypothetical protein
MNKVLTLLFKSFLPKLARNATAYLGGVLIAHGVQVNANDPAELIGGGLMILLPWIWSAVKKMADRFGGTWGTTIDDAISGEEFKPVVETLTPALRVWLSTLATKIVQGVAGFLTLQGGEVTTEGIIVGLGTYAASQLNTPDKVELPDQGKRPAISTHKK